MLANKNAVIYGGGGSMGGAVAKALAAAGARVFLSGRNLDRVKQVADEIAAAGGKAKADQVDATDDMAVDSYLARVWGLAGSIDISFNAIGLQDVQDASLAEMSVEDFLRPIQIGMRSHFITATAAARFMIRQKSGVILTLTATPGGIGYPLVGGFGPACCAIESLVRDLASEVGSHGVRVVNVRSAGSPDSAVFKAALATKEGPGFLEKLRDDTMLKEMPMMADIANTMVFLASAQAGKITGVTLDVTAGTTAALSYKTQRIPFQ